MSSELAIPSTSGAIATGGNRFIFPAVIADWGEKAAEPVRPFPAPHQDWLESLGRRRVSGARVFHTNLRVLDVRRRLSFEDATRSD